MLKIGSNQRCEQHDGERSKGGEHMEKLVKLLITTERLLGRLNHSQRGLKTSSKPPQGKLVRAISDIHNISYILECQ